MAPKPLSEKPTVDLKVRFAAGDAAWLKKRSGQMKLSMAWLVRAAVKMYRESFKETR